MRHRVALLGDAAFVARRTLRRAPSGPATTQLNSPQHSQTRMSRRASRATTRRAARQARWSSPSRVGSGPTSGKESASPTPSPSCARTAASKDRADVGLFFRKLASRDMAPARSMSRRRLPSTPIIQFVQVAVIRRRLGERVESIRSRHCRWSQQGPECADTVEKVTARLRAEECLDSLNPADLRERWR
jgi:hypothetical protein